MGNMTKSPYILDEKKIKYIDFLNTIGYNNLYCNENKSVVIEYLDNGISAFTVWMQLFNEKNYIKIIDKEINNKNKLDLLIKKYPEDIIQNKNGFFMIVSKNPFY